jgi:transcriptional regulator GlxA family with amidase domain
MPASIPPILPQRVAVLVLPGAFSLDALGCYEIFRTAARTLALRTLDPRPLDPMDDSAYADCHLQYEVELVGLRAGPVPSSGTPLFATRALSELHEPLDTFMVAGGSVQRMMQAMHSDPSFMPELRRVAALARRLASVCTGAFLLAQAGLLDGKRATTHWAAVDFLEQLYPQVRVERDPIFTRDGDVYTSAGASTGMDLALDLVRDDHGAELAHEIARWLVLYVQRPAGDAQHSLPLRAQNSERTPIRDLRAWILEHPRADLSVPALAARAGMSVRNFARAFRREVSMTPASYVEAVRVEAARRKLELGSGSLDEVAVQVGFGAVETLRRAFVRQTGKSPSTCRPGAPGRSGHDRPPQVPAELRQ